MSNLENFNNIYANLAKSAYNNRPKNFPACGNLEDEVEFNFSKTATTTFTDKNGKVTTEVTKGGTNLPNHGKVYLQPDPTVKTVTEQSGFLSKKEITYQKGLLTDEKAGYNSYFVTDTPKLNNQTQHTYFVTRGSDAAKLSTMNDWWDNNAQFTLKDAYIPQAKLATQAMHEKLNEMTKHAPNAKMNVTGHSLGTMVSIQAVANLPAGDIDKIGQVVLFQGADARASIANMSKQAQENIQQLEAAGKITYYVSPFDLVSMLNRNKKGVDEIGTVYYMLPKSYTATFDLNVENGSSHDFGQYQIDKNGTIQVANIKDHPELFAAGNELSAYIDTTLHTLNHLLGMGMGSAMAVLATISTGGTNAILEMIALAGSKLTYDQAKQIYEGYIQIVEQAKIKRNHNLKIKTLQMQIQQTTGNQKILFQEALVNEVAAQAATFGESYPSIVDNIVKETEDEIDQIVREVEEAAWTIQQYLSPAEVEALIVDFKKEALWQAAEATAIRQQTQAYQQQLTRFSQNIKEAVTSMQHAEYKVRKLFEEKR